MRFVKVRYLDTNKVATLEQPRGRLRRGQKVVVFDEEKGEDLAVVLGPSKEPASTPLRPRFVRPATRRDLKRYELCEKESKRAYEVAKEKIKEHGLEMHLLKAYVPLNRKKVFFYYLAEERVDFRALVRDLARAFKRRIEMRQVGVRDAVQMMGWVGRCMRETCCSVFGEGFKSISLKDIKFQNLPLSPSKFTGPCGRLVCCMAFERSNYALKYLFPEEESTLCYGGKEVKLLQVDPLRQLVLIEDGEGKKLELPASELLPKGYEKAVELCARCECCVRGEEEADHEVDKED
ncbi:MAG: hypothetical protein GXO03_05400 [Aquificae bacterium]|nr:hypothetical protein [Aquificota bacterium]